jgi:hypothetical protein
MHVGSTWGTIRELMGPEAACTVLYDDPGLAAEIVAYEDHVRRTYLFPLVELLRPEIMVANEDNCYRGAISPRHFTTCACLLPEIASVARDCGVPAVTVDSDGNVMELVPLLDECGVNAILPCEVKAGNDLFALRRTYPDLCSSGGWRRRRSTRERGRNPRRAVREGAGAPRRRTVLPQRRSRHPAARDVPEPVPVPDPAARPHGQPRR